MSVTLPAGANHRSWARLAEHHVERLAAADVVRDPAGYPVTSLPRTAVDLADGLPLPGELVLVDAAMRLLCASFVANPRRRDYSNPRLADAARDQLASVARRLGRTGLGLAIELGEPARESAAESLSAGHFHLGGVPRPLFNPPVETPFGIFYPDCLWVEQGVIGECDGAMKYTAAGDLLREKDREQVFRDLGYGVVRWQPKEFAVGPDVVVGRVLRALGLG